MYKKMLYCISIFFQIFVVLNAGDISQEIYSIIISKKYNWKWLLLAVALFALNNPECAQVLKGKFLFMFINLFDFIVHIDGAFMPDYKII